MTGGRWPDGDTGGACAGGIGAAWKVHGNQAAGSAKTAERLLPQGAQVVDRIDPVQPAGLDQAAQHIADIGAVLVLVEQAVVAVTHAELQRLFGGVVVQRRTGDAQKPRQRRPALEHVVEGLAQAAIGLHLLVGELLLHPALERVHHRGAVGLMVGEALRRAELGIDAVGLLPIHRCDGRDHVRAGVGEVLRDGNELTPGVHQAVQTHHPFAMALGGVGRERIGHPQHRRERGIAQRQQVVEILAGMLATGEEQADRVFADAA